MTWAGVLTRGTDWFEPVVWAAACHDLRRHDDGSDPHHGFRAGDWVRETLPLLLRMPPQALELIASACDWHVCADHKARFVHPVLWFLKDADGLDRARLYDLDPSFLRHPETLGWVEHAHRLFTATTEEQDPSRIWQVAAGIGLPVDELMEFVLRQESNVIDDGQWAEHILDRSDAD
jgi:hypothetical protein